MKHINVGTPDYEVYVPSEPLPGIIGTHDFDENEQGDAILVRSRLYYPDRIYQSPLTPKQVLRRFEEANSKVPGLDL
ncbi:hypothetical protein E3J38_05645 [candidate division TA06 bacterium]|uniref:Uncharacterized protein n=1 Tax=candidate division TA06 bacterium TaxID=2250710 RepID=A0A523XM61_UNCT6|nr:MAG: hypothetical protein E3J38_05645 [candidate division TA06 bacterium]